MAVRLIASLAVILSFAVPASAQYTWTGDFFGVWNQSLNWSPNGIPNSASASASFTGNALGTVNISSSVSTQSLLFSNPTGNYTLTSNAGVSLNSVQAITIGPAVTGVQTINLANIAAGSLVFPTGTNLLIANNSTAPGTTLVIGPNTVIGSNGGGGAVLVTGAGTTDISGSFTLGPSNVVTGGLSNSGPGTLILSNPVPNNYGGGTYVFGGTLIAHNSIPTGGNVTVSSGAQFNIGTTGNSSTTAIGTLALNGTGSFRVTGGSSDYYLNQLNMTGGTVDFTGTSNFWLHFRNAGAAITTNASPTTATWVGSATSRIQNDTAGALAMTVNSGTTPSGIDLDAAIILSNGGTNPTFIKTGPGTMRLTNTGNTANFNVLDGALRVDDMAALGSGTYFLGGASLARLVYGGPTAASTKSLTLQGISATAAIQVLTNGTNLTLNGTIGESFAGNKLYAQGTFVNGTSSTLTLASTSNSYSGATVVDGNLVLAVPSIYFSSFPSPIGSSSNSPVNLQLGSTNYRGTLLSNATGTVSTDRGATLGFGAYPNGGAIGVQNASTTMTMSGQFTGGTLIKTGAGTLTLTNGTNNFTGGTYVEAGTLNVGASGAVIPANSDVTVFSGATFQVGFPSGSNFAAPLGTLTLNGGTLRVPSGSASYYLNKLVMTGGSVDFTNSSDFWLRFGAGATFTTNASATTATWIGAGTSQFRNETGTPLTITVNSGTTASGIDLDASMLFLSFGNSLFVKTGTGTMRLTNLANASPFVVQQGALRVDDVSTGGVGALGYGAITLNGGRLAYGGANATLSKPFAVDAAGGTLDVLNAGTTLTVTSPVASNGVLNKSGPGVLVLNNLSNNYAGGIAVSGGRLDAASDAQLGLAAVTVNPFGTLRYTANATTGRTFNLTTGTLEATPGSTLTFSGAQVGGGFLSGAFATQAGTTNTFAGGTTTTATTIAQNGTGDTLTNFTNGGQLTVGASATSFLSRFTNTSSGRMTVNGTATVSEFVSNGQVNIPIGGTLANTGPSGIVLGGGSTTFVGTQATPGGVLNVGTSPMLVRGGLLVNNGVIGNNAGTGQVIVDYGGRAKGAGYYDTAPLTQNGGVFQPGNSPGRVTVGSFNFNSGGQYEFQINDANGVAGPTAAPFNGWSLTVVSNAINPANSNLNVTATPAAPFTINLRTLTPPSPPDTFGPMANFNPLVSQRWLAFDVNPAGSVTNWNPAAITLNSSGFANPFVGGFGIVRDTANPFQFYVTYTPVPEPAVVLTVALVGWVGGRLIRRRFGVRQRS